MKKHVALAALLAAAAGTGLAYGQCGVLEVVASPGVFEAGTTDIGNHCDDCSTLIALPFPVSLYGGSYTAARVGSNGTLTFGTATASPFGNTCVLPSATFTGGPTIFPHWDDLRTDQTAIGILSSVSGAPGSQRFNLEWQAIYFGTTTPISFSVSFYENQSFFDVFYTNVPNSGVSATSAVQANSTTGSSVTVYSCNAGNLISGTAIRYQCPLVANPSCGMLATPATSSPGGSFVATATVSQGIPASPIASVSLDASAVDGGTVALLDDGVFPDAAANDGIYSGNVNVGPLTGYGNQTLTSTVTDALSRTGQCTTTVNIIPPPPANDECAGAFPAVDGSNSYDTNGSTTSSGNGSPCGAIGTDVWFAWQATCGGTTTISTCNQTTVDTAIAVYDNCGSTTAVACNDDACGLQSTASFTAVAGTTYYIRMGDFAGGNPHTGTFVITPAGGGGNPTVSNATADNTCVLPGDTVTVTAAVAAVTCPALDPITSVSLDASALDAGTVAMLDDGVFPDAAANDGTYTVAVAVGGAATGGTMTVTATAASSASGSAGTNAVNINTNDEAGDLPGTALVMAGDGSPLASISGFLGANCLAGNDADMFQITICDPTTFSAATCGTGFDTQLFLFDAAGMGVAVNDDACGLQSTLTSTFTASLPAGTFYLAVSGYNLDPVDEAGQFLWLNTPFASERAPDGPGAANSVSAWSGSGGGGAYTIALTGACTVTSAPPCDPDVNQDGNVDQDDVSYLINVVGGGENPTGIDPDFNQDGNVDQDDIAALINTVGGGGCP